MKKVVIIGCGNMGSALARGICQATSLILFDRNPDKSKSLAAEVKAAPAKTLTEAVQEADCIILAIKPKDFGAQTAELARLTKSSTTLISVLSGVKVEELHKAFPQLTTVRAMPNLAVACGQGITGFVEDATLSTESKKKIDSLFEKTGMILWIPEEKMEALMAITACSPAFIAYLLEAFTEGGIYLGFSAPEALSLVMKAFEGTIALLRDKGVHPAALRWEVASPAGTTIEGLQKLEEHRVHYAIMQALIASARKKF